MSLAPRSLLAGVFLAASGASAQVRLAVVATGDCQSSALLGNARMLSGELASLLGHQVLDEAGAQSRLGPPVLHSPEDLKRQVEGAELLFYQAQARKGERQAAEALALIDRLPPGPTRWQLRAQAFMVLARIYKNTGKEQEYDDSLASVVRLAPDHQVDPMYYAPGFRARLDKIREQLRRAPKLKLSVGSSPPGAEVFLDGRRVGSTPYTGELVAGPYLLELGSHGAFSLPHPLELSSDSSAQIDMSFESSVHPKRLPCVAGGADEQARLAHGMKLGVVLGVAEVVLLRLEQPRVGPGWLTATLLNLTSGQKVREGGLKVLDPLKPEGLDELATFIATGKRGARVTVAGAPKVDPPPPLPEVALEVPKPAPALPPRVEPQPQAALTWKTSAGVGLGALGAAAAAGGVLLHIRSNASWAEFNSYYAEGQVPTKEQATQVLAIQERAKGEQVTAAVCYAFASLALGGGATLLVMDQPAPAPSASLALRPGGGLLVLSGGF